MLRHLCLVRGFASLCSGKISVQATITPGLIMCVCSVCVGYVVWREGLYHVSGQLAEEASPK